ncbi:hypothetical protein IMG5_067030 [Ichthyophthirius multifiliis]|uniref:Uncharacterized protein n=1 Tax=Ichthyophthirius multifiliis TaxID=5932 RepID=G0QPD8_ICHMU|nr:hypothetical protein IMG5_067030 [Ichthyophthirius multifiliis]EGR32906.1 hypothetical protein IMG5_067030 [Ichthyophthirius multifiliis]|eukprot:XP_004036892.1 hypothetical protein IMG5_067030 [Ichthyophthirius multifiliis]
MKKALERLHDIVFQPSIRWYKLPNPDVRRSRYPAPGSEPILESDHYIDYKTCFRDSIHNIRYHKDINPSIAGYESLYDPINQLDTEKLYIYGYLKKEDFNNQEKIQAAIQEFEKKEKRPVSSYVVYDQNFAEDKPVTKGNRESVQHFIREQFEFYREVNASERYTNDVETLYKPNLWIYKQYDLAADDPVYRQLKLDMERVFEIQAYQRQEEGYQQTFKGDPDFWQVLDSTFDPENIQKVQIAIGDKTTNYDTKDLALYHNKERYHVQGIIQYPIRTNLIIE